MELKSYTTRDLTPACVDAQLRKTGGIVLRNAISAELARTTEATLSTILNHPDTPNLYPFDLEARTGYTPAGIESSQRNPQERDTNRYLFDYRPELPIGGPVLRRLFGEAIGVCQRLMPLIDSATNQGLAQLKRGSHSLRSAQYLRQGTSRKDILFREHCDFSLLTVFIGFGEPGLEVGCKGSWVPVDLDYGDVLVGAGTPMRYFAPHYRPMLHRVVGGGSDYHVSAFLFYELGDSVPLPGRKENYGQAWRRITAEIRAPA